MELPLSLSSEDSQGVLHNLLGYLLYHCHHLFYLSYQRILWQISHQCVVFWLVCGQFPIGQAFQEVGWWCHLPLHPFPRWLPVAADVDSFDAGDVSYASTTCGPLQYGMLLYVSNGTNTFTCNYSLLENSVCNNAYSSPSYTLDCLYHISLTKAPLWFGGPTRLSTVIKISSISLIISDLIFNPKPLLDSSKLQLLIYDIRFDLAIACIGPRAACLY